VQITRQHYRGQRWHVVHDPSSNAFYRLNAVAHEFIGLLDGRRGVEEVWEYGLTRHGDAALTQNEVIQLLSQLFSSNLLAADVPPETEQLLGRGRERSGRRARQQAIGLMYFKIRLFNPDRILAWLEPIFRLLLNRIGFALWAVWVIAATIAVLPHWDRLVTGFDSAIAPSNWGWMVAVFVVVKLIHESGHGLICKRFGGQVPEFGAMMLVLLPAPYVDASATWAFPSKWRRMAVGAGGMIFELALAAGAAFAWKATLDAPGLIHQISYNVMLTASVSTVLFNANPLMKFDGYYILSDLLEVPNLMQRSTSMLKFLAQKLIYRVKSANPPTSSPSEAIILTVYGVLALIYRIFLFFSITLYVLGKLFAIGLFLAIWTATMWFVLPIGSFVHWLATSPQLAEFRPRAVATSFVLIFATLLLVGVIPLPDRRRATGVVESAQQTGIFFKSDGFVATAHVRPGQRVKSGDPIVTSESDQLVAQLRLARAQLDEALGQERDAVNAGAAAAAHQLVAREYVRTMEEQVRFLETRVAGLVLRAPHDGVVVGPDPDRFVGAFVQEGQALCEIVNEDDLRVAATLTQPEGAWLSELQPADYSVEMRLASDVDRILDARVERWGEAGQRQLPHAALSYPGGGQIETSSQDRSGLLAKHPVFRAYLVADAGSTLGAGSGIGRPGERVNLRFSLPNKPLVSQWLDRLQKLLQGRAKL